MSNHKETVISEAELLELGISEFEPRMEMAFIPTSVFNEIVVNGVAGCNGDLNTVAGCDGGTNLICF
ncbi:MAG: hypothetical protein QNK37_09520 [Acidobacteriota bacterium]|nr:hypothetical protein [Acidobacteriota bacterium]